MTIGAAVLAVVGAVPVQPPLPGGILAPLRLSTSSGRIVALPANRVTVVAAFAYWCETWRPQRQSLLKARAMLKGLPIDWAAVSVDGSFSSADPKPDWGPVLLDHGAKWSDGMGIDRVPTVMVADKDGLLRWVGYGIVKPDDLALACRAALAPKPGQQPLYLTFDDYPAPLYNRELLAVLRREQTPASLFVIGRNAARSPDWLRRALEIDGVSLQAHGWDHSADGADFPRLRRWLGERFAVRADWTRSPGSGSIVSFDGRGMPGRAIDPSDFRRPGPGELKRRVLSRLAPGAVIQLHAGVADTVAALPDIIARARRLGYEFRPLPAPQSLRSLPSAR